MDLTVIIPIAVSLISLGISIFAIVYTISKNKAILIAEPHSGVEIKREKKETEFDFYLTNRGNRPTTIKEIQFYCTEGNFLPKTTIIKILDKTILSIGLNALKHPTYESIDFPAVIGPNTTIKLLARLNFSTEEELEKQTKNGFHYTIWIKHTGGDFKQKFF